MTVSNEQIAARLDRGDKRFHEIEKKLEALPQLQEDMKVVREILEALQGLKTLGKVAMGISKPIIAIGGAIGAGWVLFKLAVWTAIKGG